MEEEPEDDDFESDDEDEVEVDDEEVFESDEDEDAFDAGLLLDDEPRLSFR